MTARPIGSLGGPVLARRAGPKCPPTTTLLGYKRTAKATLEGTAVRRCLFPAAADAASPSQAKSNGKSRRGPPWRFLRLQQRRDSRSALTNAVFDQFLSDRSGSKYGLRSIVLYDVLPF